MKRFIQLVLPLALMAGTHNGVSAELSASALPSASPSANALVESGGLLQKSTSDVCTWIFWHGTWLCIPTG